jgi:hypothetical protein
MPPRKKSKKNTPAEANQEVITSNKTMETFSLHSLCRSQTRKGEQNLKPFRRHELRKLCILSEAFIEEEVEEEDDEVVDKELEIVNQKVLMLQKEKERFANQLEAKRRALEKLEKLNQTKEQLEKMQREIDEMKEQENNSLWRDSPHQKSGQHKRTLRENFFTGNEISPFADPESPLSLGLQTTPWPLKYKLVSLPKYNGHGHSRQFIMSYEAALNPTGGDDVALAKSFIIACEAPVLNWYSLFPPHLVCS